MLTEPEEQAVLVLAHALAGTTGGQFPTAETQTQALRTLLAAVTAPTGLDAATIEVRTPQVAVLHQRHPDASCDIEVYLDDQPVNRFDEESIDPGAGVLRSELDERIENLSTQTTRFAAAATSALVDARESTYVDDDRPEDVKMLEEAKFAVLVAYPDAQSMHLTTSDQDTYGFWLHDVKLADGRWLSVADTDAHTRLVNQVSELLVDLDWDAHVGEDAHGNAHIALR